MGLHKFDFIKRNGDEVTIITWNAGTFPVFSRTRAGEVYLSNYPHLLLVRGETVSVKAQVIATRITGSGNQLYSPFCTPEHLQDSAQYAIVGGRPRYKASLLKETAVSNQYLRDYWFERFKAYANERTPAAIPLSGGYDSRLILALASHAGVHPLALYHEIKDEFEQTIADRVAEAYNLAVNHFTRQDQWDMRMGLSLNTEFILQSGLNRQNIRRWTVAAAVMRQQHGPETRIIGLAGAEPHKGKYYAKIQSIAADAMKAFRVNTKQELAGASALHLHDYEDFHTSEIERLVEQAARLYSARESQIDYIHYHAYMVGSYGYRSAYFSDAVGIDYPQHDTKFLNNVFSMPPSEKVNYKVITRLLAEIDRAREVVFISANDKTLKPKPSVTDRIIAKTKSLMAPAKIVPVDCALINERPRGDLTTRLLCVAKGIHPGVQQAEAITAFNYFATLERQFDVSFRVA